MNPPLIGITTYQKVNEQGYTVDALGAAYVNAVLRAGGLPLLLPVQIPPAHVPGLLARLDGLLLTGGADIDPALFGGIPHPEVYDIDAERDALEIELVRQAAATGFPFLGICRGIQVINVALGGTLYTHIPDQHPNAVRHDYYPGFRRDHLAHPVELEPGTRLCALLDAPVIETNSLHHQGIHRLAPPLTAAATAPDGLVEAVELANHPFAFGVQWHPEAMPESESTQTIFRAFIQACA